MTAKKRMSEQEFNRRVAILGTTSESLLAARGILVDGLTYRAACRAYGGISGQAFRLVRRIRGMAVCRCCGQEIRK